MLTLKNKLFFVIFFGLILISIAHAYYQIEVRKQFHVFSEDEEIPRALDFYLGLTQ